MKWETGQRRYDAMKGMTRQLVSTFTSSYGDESDAKVAYFTFNAARNAKVEMRLTGNLNRAISHLDGMKFPRDQSGTDL
eukprot:Pgem_evm1s10614